MLHALPKLTERSSSVRPLFSRDKEDITLPPAYRKVERTGEKMAWSTRTRTQSSNETRDRLTHPYNVLFFSYSESSHWWVGFFHSENVKKKGEKILGFEIFSF